MIFWKTRKGAQSSGLFFPFEKPIVARSASEPWAVSEEYCTVPVQLHQYTINVSSPCKSNATFHPRPGKYYYTSISYGPATLVSMVWWPSGLRRCIWAGLVRNATVVSLPRKKRPQPSGRGRMTIKIIPKNRRNNLYHTYQGVFFIL